MEMMVRKYQQKFRKVKDEMARWEELQTQFISQFRNASSIIQRLQVLNDNKNYGALGSVHGIKEILLGKQLESLERIFFSMIDTLKEFHVIVMFLGKIEWDAKQLVKGGSIRPTEHQMQMQIGMRPSIEYCLFGLKFLHEMHLSEYLVKSSIVQALSINSRGGFLQFNAEDLGALHQLLVDQPNIPKNKVRSIFNVIFADETC